MAITLNRGRMLPAPLPWLTALIKSRVRDYVDVTIHILHPLAVIAFEALYVRHGNNGEASAQDRARIKQLFINGVYCGTSSTESKRQLLGIPFDELFNLCVCELPLLEGHPRDLAKEQNERLRYLLSCAMYPQADIDGTLAPDLQRYYEWTFWPRDLSPEAYSLSSFDKQVQAAHQDEHVFPGMTRFIGDNILVQDGSAESIEHMITHFLWLAMSAVDIYSTGGATSIHWAAYPSTMCIHSD